MRRLIVVLICSSLEQEINMKARYLRGVHHNWTSECSAHAGCCEDHTQRFNSIGDQTATRKKEQQMSWLGSHTVCEDFRQSKSQGLSWIYRSALVTPEIGLKSKSQLSERWQTSRRSDHAIRWRFISSPSLELVPHALPLVTPFIGLGFIEHNVELCWIAVLDTNSATWSDWINFRMIECLTNLRMEKLEFLNHSLSPYLCYQHQ